MVNNSSPHASCSDQVAIDRLLEGASCGYPRAPRPTNHTFAVVRSISPPLNHEESVIAAIAGTDDAECATDRYASACFEGEPSRARKRWVVNVLLRTTDLVRGDLHAFLDRVTREFDMLPRTDQLLTVREKKPHIATLIARGGLFLFYSTFFGTAFVSEYVSASYLVSSAGIGFEGRHLLALAFCSSIVGGPYIWLKHQDACLSMAGKRRFRRMVNWVAGITSVVTVALFSATLGSAMHREIDVFGGDAAAASPTLWPIFAASAVMLALVLSMCGYLMRIQFDSFFGNRSEPNAQFANAAEELGRIQSEIEQNEMISLLGKTTEGQLDAQKEAFRLSCQSARKRIELARAAKRAQSELDQ